MTEQSPPPAGMSPNSGVWDFIEQDQQDVVVPPGSDQEWRNLVPVAAAKAQQAFEREEGLRHRATHDKLTGLLNLDGFDEKLRAYLDQTGIKEIDLIFVDGTNTKAVNDRIDHDTGDMTIRGFADLLEKSIREGDILARIGGDEFVIVPNGIGELPPNIPEERRVDRHAPEASKQIPEIDGGKSLEERIAEETAIFLADHPELREVGVEVAVGRVEAKMDANFNFAELKKAAELKMMVHKKKQHAVVGQHRQN